MSNLERDPDEIGMTSRATAHDTGATVTGAPAIEILEPREVPLGGPRAMTVRRTLPQRKRSLIGAWCFLDHYGPDDVEATGGMRVPGHPHTGLATVTWLFEGEVEHRDTVGTVRLIRPGEVNLMTSGAGIAHSEYSTPATTRMHGAQLWLALPDAERRGPRRFENYTAPQVEIPGGRLRVFIGSLEGQESPVTTFSPLLGAEIAVGPGAEIALEIASGFEHGVLVDTGSVQILASGGRPGSAVDATAAQLVYIPVGSDTLRLRGGPDGTRVLLIGGTPFGESIVMWWNFIGRDHDEIVADRAAWQRRVERLGAGERDDDDFGDFPDVWSQVLPAPELPTVRLRPRV
ncbi:MAG: pirin family protein [Naasia sp.]